MNVIEIERAFIINDIAKTRDCLSGAGFALAKKEKQRNDYFEHPFFPGMIDQKKYLRARYIDDAQFPSEITFSAPVMNPATGTETREQFSIPTFPRVQHALFVARRVIESMGFVQKLSLRKKREYYINTGTGTIDETVVHVELDFWIAVTDANQHETTLEDTIQVCIEHHGDGKPDIPSIEMEFDRVASSIGIDPGTAIGMDYFERYFTRNSLERKKDGGTCNERE